MRVNKISKAKVRTIRIFEFSDFFSLADCAVMLLKRHIPCAQSKLYKLGDSYRLILSSGNCRDWIACSEFCRRQSTSALEVAYTEEYGESLLEANAVRRIGYAFMKDSSKR